MIFLNKLVRTPGFAKSLRKSTPTSFGDFLSNFLANGNGRVEMRDLRKLGIESNRELNSPLDLCRKVVKSV
jgi:hypothetical protein